MDSATATNQFKLAEWLSKAKQLGASDAHFHSGYPPLFRLNGAITAMDQMPIYDAVLRPELFSLLSGDERKKFEERRDVEFTYEVPGIARFRASLFLTHTGINSSFRVLSAVPSKLEELGLPPELAKIAEFEQGLVLITGPISSGKSTTLAAIVDIINEQRQGEHILCLDDATEIVHGDKRCVVNQRQIGMHSESYARAMRAALREDPDVLVLGDLRDPERIALALGAAETGHLVLGCMHTADTMNTIGRIIDSFPPEKQDQTRAVLAEVLQSIFSQMLLPTADGKSRVVAYEFMIMNASISNLISENRLSHIPSIMQTGRASGMATLSQIVSELMRADRISREIARLYVDDAYLF